MNSNISIQGKLSLDKVLIGKNKSTQWLVTKTGFTWQTINKWRKQKGSKIYAHHLFYLANVLDVDVYEIFELT